MDECLDWKRIELGHYGRLRVKCECYVYLLIYVQDKWQRLLSVTYYLYYNVHWFCFWVGDYPLSVWLLKPSIISFFPRYKSIGAYQAYCYPMLICVEL